MKIYAKILIKHIHAHSYTIHAQPHSYTHRAIRALVRVTQFNQMQGQRLGKSASEWKIKRKMPLARISDFSILMVRGKFMLNEGKTQQNETKKI